jgi:hypothetical protein
LNKRAILCACVAAALTLEPSAWTQQSVVSTPAQTESGGLTITVIQGSGATNYIQKKHATQPVVEVRDEANQPVSGADVVFQLPTVGPGGSFDGWLSTQTTKTDAHGRAAASGLTPNDQQGQFVIKVMATRGTKTATTMIGQTNASGGGEAQAGGSHKRLWVVLGVLAAGGVAGGIAATRGGGSAPPTVNPITVAAGPIAVGGPR